MRHSGTTKKMKRSNTMGAYRIACMLWTVLLLAVPLASAGENVPHEISGFKLGFSIDDYEFISYRNFLKEVIIEDVGGFRKGVISYGVCERPGEIVRIKLKYRDNTRKFFNKLFKRYKQKFGEADEFTGDAFGIVLSWKWRFEDKDKNAITLELQHNLKNSDENIGNMVKLSMPDRIEAERKCFNKVCNLNKVPCPVESMKEDWENLLPR